MGGAQHRAEQIVLRPAPLRLQPPGDSRGVRWARAGSCSISGKLVPVKNGSLGPDPVVNSNQKKNLHGRFGLGSSQTDLEAAISRSVRRC